MTIATVLQIAGLIGLGASLVLLGIPGLVLTLALVCLSAGVALEVRSTVAKSKVDR